MTQRTNSDGAADEFRRVSDETVKKAWRAAVEDMTSVPAPASYRGPLDQSAMRAALESVWPEPLLNDAERTAVIVALRFTDSGENYEEVMSAIAKLEAEDNRRYDESDGHA